jgi:hypothetical protein
MRQTGLLTHFLRFVTGKLAAFRPQYVGCGIMWIMTTLNVSLPDDVLARLKAKLEPLGCTVEQFAATSLSGFADAGEFVSPELEAKLLDALRTPLLEPSQIDWDAKIERLWASTR